MLKYFDSVVQHIVNHLVFGSLAVQAYHNRMCNISPHYEVFNGDISASAMISFACTVDGRAVVAGACKEMLLVDVVACEDVKTVAPTIPAHHLCILHRYRVAATNRQLSGKRTVDKNIL